MSSIDTIERQASAARVPIIVGGHSEAAVRRARGIADGFFPATGSQVGPVGLIERARRAAAEAGRDPDALEITMGCPGTSPGASPIAAIEQRRAVGGHRIALPAAAFLPEFETTLARFGADVIREVT